MSNDELAQFKQDLFNRLWVLAGAFWTLTIVCLAAYFPLAYGVSDYKAREQNIDKSFFMLGIVEVPKASKPLSSVSQHITEDYQF